jgi:cytochrome c oxidase cbb3-type subunit 4
MSTYDTMRHFADTWVLVLMTVVFVGIVAWVLRPGSRKSYRDQAEIPFRHDDRPAAERRGHDHAGGD